MGASGAAGRGPSAGDNWAPRRPHSAWGPAAPRPRADTKRGRWRVWRGPRSGDKEPGAARPGPSARATLLFHERQGRRFRGDLRLPGVVSVGDRGPPGRALGRTASFAAEEPRNTKAESGGRDPPSWTQPPAPQAQTLGAPGPRPLPPPAPRPARTCPDSRRCARLGNRLIGSGGSLCGGGGFSAPAFVSRGFCGGPPRQQELQLHRVLEEGPFARLPPPPRPPTTKARVSGRSAGRGAQPVGLTPTPSTLPARSWGSRVQRLGCPYRPRRGPPV